MSTGDQSGRHHHGDISSSAGVPKIWDIGAPARLRFSHDREPSTDLVACRDCLSEQTIEEVAPGIFSVNVQHDDWCPWYKQLQRDLA